MRKNFKIIQRNVEQEQRQILTALKTTANASLRGQATDQTLASLDNMIKRMNNLKKKMEILSEDEQVLRRQSLKRIEHLSELYTIPSLADVKYDEWSRVRLDRLLVDYLLRMGYTESAKALAAEKGIGDLVDLNVFEQCHRIEECLRSGSTAEGLAWCTEHKALMKKTGVGIVLDVF